MPKIQSKISIKDLITLTLLFTIMTIILAKKTATNPEKLATLQTAIKSISNPSILAMLTLITLTLTAYSLKNALFTKDKILIGFNGPLPAYIDLSTPRHVVIFGMTGSGKTETAKRIALNSKKKKLIIDWAGEYQHGLTATPKLLTLNLKPHEIVDSIASAFHLSMPQQAVLYEASKEAKNLSDIIKKIREIKPATETQREIRDAILRRLLPLESMKLFSGELNLSEIDTLDLSSLTYEAKKLVANIVLRMFYNSPEPRVLVVEEAQNIIPRQPPGNPPTSAELIINELRKRGVSVILVAQTPSQISLAFRNADYIIMHRLQLTPSEAQVLGISKDEAERLAQLETGHCLIIERGRKRWIKILIAKKRKSSPINIKTKSQISMTVKEPLKNRESNSDRESKKEIIDELIEDLTSILKWKREASTKIEKLEEIVSKLTQDIQELSEAWEAAKHAEIASNPTYISNFIKRTSEKLAQLSVAIAVLRRRYAELQKKQEEERGNESAYIKEIEKKISLLNEKVEYLENAAKRHGRAILEVRKKLSTLHYKLIDFERWIKEELSTIA